MIIPRRIRIFLSSPGDVAGTREADLKTGKTHVAIYRRMKERRMGGLQVAAEQAQSRARWAGVTIALVLIVAIGAGACTSSAVHPDAQNTRIPPTVTQAATPYEPAIVSTLVGLSPVTSNEAWQPMIRLVDGVEMVVVPPGCFMMGSEERDRLERNDDEQKPHEQCFDKPFWIDRYEVTNAQFGSFAGCADYSRQPDQPRGCMNWFQARDHCAQRGVRVRLPTEAEWEYAARGPDNWVRPWGNEFNLDIARGISSGPADVGSQEGDVSWVGAYDLGGNVSEWVSSIYALYPYPNPYDPTDGREDLERTGVGRVLRGDVRKALNFSGTGAIILDPNLDDIDLLRAADRLGLDPVNKFPSNGFRCARSFL